MARIDKPVKIHAVHDKSQPKPMKKGSVHVRRPDMALTDVQLIKRASNTRVSKHDPLLLEKLQLKLASLVALSENMVKTNQFLRNDDRDGLLRQGYSAEGVEELFFCGQGKQVGFSEQELQNMDTEIRSVEARIANCATSDKHLESMHQTPVAFQFPEAPITSVRQLLGIRGAAWRLKSKATPLQLHQQADSKPSSASFTYH